MLDNNDRSAVAYKMPKHSEQCLYIKRMQAYRRLVEHKHGILLPASHFTRELKPLSLTSRQTRGSLAQSKVSQAQVVKHLKPAAYKLQVRASLQSLVNAHLHQLGKRLSVGAADIEGLAGVARTMAVRARNIYVGKELDVQADTAGAVAHRAAQFACIV